MDEDFDAQWATCPRCLNWVVLAEKVMPVEKPPPVVSNVGRPFQADQTTTPGSRHGKADLHRLAREEAENPLRTCRRCGEPLEKSWRYCPNCNAPQYVSIRYGLLQFVHAWKNALTVDFSSGFTPMIAPSFASETHILVQRNAVHSRPQTIYGTEAETSDEGWK